MEEMVEFDQPSSTFNCDDIYVDDRIDMPPLDYVMLNNDDDDLSFPDNLAFVHCSEPDLDFTIQDLDFIDDLLSDPGPDTESGSPVGHSGRSAVSVSPEIANGVEAPGVSVAKREEEESGPLSSQGSGNGKRDVSKASRSKLSRKSHSPESGSCDLEFDSPDSCQSSPHFSTTFNAPTLKAQDLEVNRVAESRIKIEEVGSKFTPKRKKEQQCEETGESRTKFRKSSEPMEDDKKKSRLMRNRESAQLSRQRKKQYVDELEDKVKSMHSTITELNTKISYIMAENATLRQQMNGGGVCPPPPPMGYYPWMPCPAYVVKQHGSQVPLVPIPRLKPQQPVSAPKISKKPDKLGSKKDVGKTKKVASISFLGLLFFMLLFGGLVPVINVNYGGKLSDHDRFNKAHNGRILMVDGHPNETSHDGVFKGQQNGSVPVGNSSEHLAASLYVPRNDKLVKIDGNLIIHSVLASERAVSSHGIVQMKTSEETRLAIARNHAPSYHVNRDGKSNTRGSHRDNSRLNEWFSEDLSGSLLRSGMCTEVFQFDVSPSTASIVPAAPMTHSTRDERKNSTNTNRSRNRRFLSGYSVPLDLHALNVSKEPKTEKGKLEGNNSSSSMVVSVLVDPREAGEIDAEGVIKSKSVSRIFVVVLIDSVKYVTYSCMLPFLGGGGNKLSAE